MINPGKDSNGILGPHTSLTWGRGCICIKFTFTFKLFDADGNQCDAFQYNNYTQNPYCDVVDSKI